MAPSPSTCRYLYGIGDCSEFNSCSGNGNCTYGLCACEPGYLGLDCANFIECKYWDTANETWSTEGVVTVYVQGAVYCETTHLTDFGGVVSFPTTPDALLQELEKAFHFNSFTMDEMFDLLNNFNFGDNLTIMIILIVIFVSDLISLAILGIFRGYRKHQLRKREGRMYEHEQMDDEIKQMKERKKRFEQMNSTSASKAASFPGMLSQAMKASEAPSPPPSPPETTTRRSRLSTARTHARKSLAQLNPKHLKKEHVTALGTRIWRESVAFCGRLVENARSEHTIINFLAPPDDEEALTPSQIIHCFWTTLSIELMIVCLQAQPPPGSTPDSGGSGLRGGSETSSAPSAPSNKGLAAAIGTINLFQAFTSGVIASTLTIVGVMICGYAFRAGNSRQYDNSSLQTRIQRRWRRFKKSMTPQPVPPGYEADYRISPYGWICLLCCVFAFPFNLLGFCMRRRTLRYVPDKDDDVVVGAPTNPRAMARVAAWSWDPNAASAVPSPAASPARPTRPKSTRCFAMDPVSEFSEYEAAFSVGGSIPTGKKSAMRGKAPVPAAMKRRVFIEDVSRAREEGESSTSSGPFSPRDWMVEDVPSPGAPQKAMDAAFAMAFAGQAQERKAKPPGAPEKAMDAAFAMAFEGKKAKPPGAPEKAMDAAFAMAFAGQSQEREDENEMQHLEERTVPTKEAIRMSVQEDTQRKEHRKKEHRTKEHRTKGDTRRKMSKRHRRHRADHTLAVLAAVKLQRAWRTRRWRKAFGRVDDAPGWNSAWLEHIGWGPPSVPPSPPQTPSTPKRFSLRTSNKVAPVTAVAKKPGRVSWRQTSKAVQDTGAGSKTRRPSDMSDLATVAAVAALEAKLTDMRWRHPWSVIFRKVVAWIFNFFVMGICMFYSLIIALKFGEDSTRLMIASWVLAYGATFAIIEPLQIILLAATPFLFVDTNACGRCALRARFIYNEYLAP